MTPQKYIIEKIKELQLLPLNSCIKIRYAYDKVTKFHIVEVSPETIRRGNDAYMDWEYSVIKEFCDLFPEEDILISEPDECNDMSNIEYDGFTFCDDFKNKPKRTKQKWDNVGFSEFYEDEYLLAS